jgi:formate hydrogenlyase transcriptional activator
MRKFWDLYCKDEERGSYSTSLREAMSNTEVQRLHALLKIPESSALHDDLPSTFRSLASCLAGAVRFDVLCLILRDGDRVQVLTKNPGSEADVREVRETTIPAQLDGNRSRPVALSRAESREWFSTTRFLNADQLECIVVLPLIASRHSTGSMVLGSARGGEYHNDDFEFLELAAKQVAIAIDKFQTYQKSVVLQQELLHERDRLKLLLDVSNAVTSKLDVRQLFHAISISLRKVMQCDFASLAFPDEDDEKYLRFTVIDDAGGGKYLREDSRLPIHGSATGFAFRTGTPLVLNSFEEARNNPEIYGNVEGGIFFRRLSADEFKSGCFLPIVGKERVIGVLSLTKRLEHAFAKPDVDLLWRVAGQISIAVENALAYRAIDELKERIEGERLYLEDEIRNEYFDEIVGESPALVKVLDQVRTVAETASTVLILGETGSGKELIARAIHNLSPRRKKTFVKLNCAAIPSGLLESELFGHERGAFTGAIAQRVGRMELADQGTLFLDEVGDIPPELQPKLLRALQEREFERLGGTRTIRSDVRLIAATHRDLTQMVANREFRSDLYYRLNVFPIRLPPLRERADDVPRLVRHFVSKHAQRMNRNIETISSETMEALMRWSWPGNVRELENLMERAVILSRGPVLNVPISDLRETAPPVQPAASKSEADNTSTLEDSERQHILKVLRETRGVLGGPGGAAERLGLKRTTLQGKMKKLGITRNSI